MADVYEKNLAQKSSLTTSDYIRVVGSDNVSYKQGMTSVKSTLGVTALENKLSGVTFTKIIVNSGASKSVTLPNNYRGVFYSSASSSACNGEYLVFATGTGSVTVNTVKEATGLSISTATNKITFTPSVQSYIVFMNFNGTATV